MRLRYSASLEAAITPSDVLRFLRRRSLTCGIFREIPTEEETVEAARQVGLAMSDAELQRAADRFRYRHGFVSAEDTRRWLAEQWLTVEDWEAGLEHELLIEKFKDHLFATTGEAHFRDHRDTFARVRLRRLVVATDGFARELLAQVREEGRAFEEIAATRSADPAGGDLGDVFRRQLPGAIAEAVFAARPGDVVGPFHTRHGHELYQVGDQRPADLDAVTAILVREEVFAAWVRDKMVGVRITLTGLDGA
jgi:parvulin-like peptidyl-prolyl isomerase